MKMKRATLFLRRPLTCFELFSFVGEAGYTNIAVTAKPISADMSIYGMVMPLLNINITHMSAATVSTPQVKSNKNVTALSFIRRSARVSPTKQNLLMPPIKKQKAQRSKLIII